MILKPCSWGMNKARKLIRIRFEKLNYFNRVLNRSGYVLLEGKFCQLFKRNSL